MQREVINIAELATKFMRAYLEKKKILISSIDLETKIREIKLATTDIQLSLKEPKRVSHDLPPKIELLAAELTSLQTKILLKRTGMATFTSSKRRIASFYEAKFKREAFGLSESEKLDTIVTNITIFVVFVIGYPHFVRDAISGAYNQLPGIKLSFKQPSLPSLLLGDLGHFEMIKL